MYFKSTKEFNSRRSTCMSPRGMVATSNPMAVSSGLKVLMNGGNAIDAAIATAATLCVVEPRSTGIGGDAFAIVYHAKSDQIYGLNASGPEPENSTIEKYRDIGYDEEIPSSGIYATTVPGSVKGWEKILSKFGTCGLDTLLTPAIEFAENGYPVTEVLSREWKEQEKKLQKYGKGEFLKKGKAPEPGEVMKTPNLGASLRMIADKGPDAFYEGEIAEKIVEESDSYNGFFQISDLANYEPEWVQPLTTDYRGYTVHEIPPNDQGIIALIALNIVEGFDLSAMGHNSADYLHTLIEAIKLAFADGKFYVSDPSFEDLPLKQLCSKRYGHKRRGLINSAKANQEISHGIPNEGDTVYMTVVDEDGNMVSFIQSLFQGFGSGIEAGDTGIVLQNRGHLFSLDPNHHNSLQPGKRPYHTIIPAFLSKNGRPVMSFGVMGGTMQPQGHLQVICNMIDFHMSPQDAIDALRFRFIEGPKVALERRIPEKTKSALIEKGHKLVSLDSYSVFGGAQAIWREDNGTLFGGSEPRKDGSCLGY